MIAVDKTKHAGQALCSRFIRERDVVNRQYDEIPRDTSRGVQMRTGLDETTILDQHRSNTIEEGSVGQCRDVAHL